jgi:hypothetical protein
MTSEEFYLLNKDCVPYFPPIPRENMTDEEVTDWLFTVGVPYIELDIEFNWEEWLKESKIAESYLVKHREGQNHYGWNSCCIHGIAVDKTGIWHQYSAVEPEYNWTSLSDITPTIKQFWQNFPFEKLARVRFMQVEAHGYVEPHNDTPPNTTIDNMIDNLVPINIAISHPNNCYMTLRKHGIVPWQNKDVKIVNITNDHSVINFSDEPRMHLIAHGLVGNKKKEFSELIARSYKKQYEHYRIS